MSTLCKKITYQLEVAQAVFFVQIPLNVTVHVLCWFASSSSTRDLLVVLASVSSFRRFFFQFYPQQLLASIGFPFSSVRSSFLLQSASLSVTSVAASCFNLLSFHLYPQQLLASISFPLSSIRSSILLQLAFLSTLSAADLWFS
jgi:hypothetical protein